MCVSGGLAGLQPISITEHRFQHTVFVGIVREVPARFELCSFTALTAVSHLAELVQTQGQPTAMLALKVDFHQLTELVADTEPTLRSCWLHR